MKNTVYILISVLLLTSACKDESGSYYSLDSSEFPDVIPLESKVVKLSEDLFIPSAVASSAKYLVVVDNTRENILKVFNLPELSHAFNFGNTGGGPNDFAMVDPSTAFFNKGKFEIQDNNKLKTFEVFRDSMVLVNTRVLPILGNPINRLSRLNDSIYVADNAMDDELAELIKINIDNQEIVQRFGEYPETELEFSNPEQKYFAFVKDIVSDEQKGVFATFYFTFNRFKIYDQNCSLIKEVRIESQDNRDYSIDSPKDNLVYHAGLLNYESYIYALSVMKTKNDVESDIEGYKPKLVVWDWEGNPVARYQLDQPLISFTISNGKVYGFGMRSLNEVYVYDLPNLGYESSLESTSLEGFENDYFRTSIISGWERARDEYMFDLAPFSCVEELYYDPARHDRSDGNSSTMRIRMLTNDTHSLSIDFYRNEYSNKAFEGALDFELDIYKLNEMDVMRFTRSIESSGFQGSSRKLFACTWVWENSGKLFELSMYDYRNENPNLDLAKDIILNTIPKI
jgi:hypothetical protein